MLTRMGRLDANFDGKTARYRHVGEGTMIPSYLDYSSWKVVEIGRLRGAYRQGKDDTYDRGGHRLSWLLA